MFSFSFRHRLCLLAVFCTLCLTASVAQKAQPAGPVVKFGVIYPDQFTSSTADSTASAVILYDYGEVTFDRNDNDLWLVSQYHVRIHIRKKAAYDRATIQLPVRIGHLGQHESVSDFEGYTYNLVNGNVSTDRLTKAGHFTEKASDQLMIEKYTLPNVHEGSIIDYRYTVRTPFSVGYNPRTWRFQQDVPVKWSEYRITIPDYFYYKMLLSGYLRMIVNEQTKGKTHLLPGQDDVQTSVYRFAMKDVPAFREEAYMTMEDDYMAKIEFELASYQLPDVTGIRRKDFSVGWDAFDRTLLNDADFGGKIKRTGSMRETAKALLSQQADTLSRIKSAYEFIRQNIKWNDEASLWSTESTKKIIDNKKGNAADINLLLIALLREMDIDANPVVLSTRSHGRINEAYALIKKFNYVVAQVSVGGKDMLLDATDPYVTLGMLPVRCLNGTGRLVHPTKPRFVSLLPLERDVEVYTGTFTLNDDGGISGKFIHSHGGYSAWNARRELAVEGKKKFLETIQKQRPAWQIEQATLPDGVSSSGAFTTDYTISIPEACSRAGDRLYFYPMLTEAHRINPFKETERLYPVDFGVPIEENFTATYTLPKGFRVEEMPKPVSMSLPGDGGRFLYHISVNAENQLLVTSRFILRRPLYYAEEYGALRELFSQVIAKQAEQVVLKRETVAETR
ncbi:DUF3857 domain-containing protein [Spirosoma oryzicola]|uniref:DUF3857 domain-containing protein n=1 Tax=Spirosoma oryzicola TaxID=2898794 RepID=UPI001E3697D8|nr:DUF3857 domain-containing protein [Spirosoma oryzicola]UHG90151.1 DUF3857 and transglutaminase domain-containing protein [Spirosoma oryzicola]